MATQAVGTATATTRRSRAKSDRRSQLIAAAERLVAERGYLAVRLEDIGAAVGVSGPAIYRHFPNKEALLVELLVGISTRLLAGATDVVETAAANGEDAATALDGLIDFHLDFALGESDLIRIQDQDLGHLPPTARRLVRRSQRQYVEIWVGVLRQLDETRSEADARLMAHATFGLLNSTPHSVKPGAAKATEASSRAVLRAMTVAALTSGRAER
jgi:AcrR family transcriptional regulator